MMTAAAGSLFVDSHNPDQREDRGSDFLNCVCEPCDSPTFSRFASRRTLFITCVKALRPWTFGLSLTSSLLGVTLGARSTGELNFCSCVLTLLTITCTHAAGNLLNTFYDHCLGIDDVDSDDQTLVSGLLLPSEVSHLGLTCYITSLLLYFLLTAVSSARSEHLAFLFFCGVSGSLLYSAGHSGLKYHGPGELVLLLCFGPVCMLFAWVAQGAPLSLAPLPYVLVLCILHECRFHVNNVRSLYRKSHARNNSLASCLSSGANYCVFVATLFGPYFFLLVLSVVSNSVFILPVLTIPQALKIESLYRKEPLHMNPSSLENLGFQFGLLYISIVALLPEAHLPFSL